MLEHMVFARHFLRHW